MTSHPAPVQQRPQDGPLPAQPIERELHPGGLDLQGPPLRVHTLQVVPDREGMQYAVCSCGWVSAQHIPGYGVIRLLCEVGDMEREGRRNARALRDAGGPVEG